MSLDYKGLLPDSVGAVKVQASTPKIKPKMDLDYKGLLSDAITTVKGVEKVAPKIKLATKNKYKFLNLALV